MGVYVPRMLLEELSVNNDLLQDTSSLLAYITNFVRDIVLQGSTDQKALVLRSGKGKEFIIQWQ
jgi:hypothetical protein